MAADRRVYDSRHLQADCKEPGSAPEPCAGQSSMDYFYLYYNGIFGLIFNKSYSTNHLKPFKTKVLAEK